MRECVMLKGNRGGLQLLFNEDADFSDVLNQLENKIKLAANFFQAGITFRVPYHQRALTEEEKEQLTELLANYGMSWVEMENLEIDNANQQEQSAETLVVARTVRNGQSIEHSGSIIILGDVNPGAKIMAGGDIVIKGTCRGVVQAGHYGDQNSTITASKLMASQLRIAHLISRAPDDLAEPLCEERARIKDGKVIIEPTYLNDKGDNVNE